MSTKGMDVVNGCRMCVGRGGLDRVVGAGGGHTIDHDIIAMRNVIGGAISREEAREALDRIKVRLSADEQRIAQLERELADLGAQE